MTLTKAREILAYHRRELNSHTDADTQEALKLGIEALKAVKDVRVNGITTRLIRLPGESED